MRVTVQLFARLREIAGGPEWVVDVPEGASIADVWGAACARHPGLGDFAAAVSAARNEEFAPLTAIVSDGDAIAFLPPVSGGAK